MPKQLNAWRAFESERTGFESEFCLLTPLGPWASCTASMGVRFLLIRLMPVIMTATGTVTVNIHYLLLCGKSTTYLPTHMDDLSIKGGNIYKTLNV